MHCISKLIVALASSVAALSAAAQVTIVDDNVAHYAIGTFNSAFAVYNNAFLQCRLLSNELMCIADDGAGKHASCATTDPAFKRLFPMMKKHSTVRFFWRPDGRCELVEVSVDSRSLRAPPKLPGEQRAVPVSVDATRRIAGGTLALVPGFPNQDIGCTAQSAATNLYCIARDEAGRFIWCTSSGDSLWQTLADQMLAVAGLNESSELSFTWDDNPVWGHTCTGISVTNFSRYLP